MTRATLPDSGAARSYEGALVRPAVPMRTTCPQTYADFGESRKASVDEIAPSAPAATYTVWAVDPLPSSLPSERVMPSRARCAIARPGVSACSGGVPRSTTRPQPDRLRRTGVRNSWIWSRPAAVSMPVASKTIPFTRAPSATASVVVTDRLARASARAVPSVEPGAAPTRTVPSTRGAPAR